MKEEVIVKVGDYKAKVTEVGYIGFGVVYLEGPHKGWSDWIANAQPVQVVE